MGAVEIIETQDCCDIHVLDKCMLCVHTCSFICLSFSTKPATISNVWCLEICAGTLFLMLLKFGAVLSVICGFLMVIYTWTHLLPCIVVVRSFLRMLKLRKLAVRKLYFSRWGRTRCQSVLDHGLNLHWNIPLNMWQVLVHLALKGNGKWHWGISNLCPA